MRKVFISSAAVVLMLCASSICLACDCVTPPPGEAFDRASSVFEGEMISIARSGSELVYTFRVRKSLKGSNGAQVVIVGGESNCDYSFALNGIYRVYARTDDGKLKSGACSGNQFLSVSLPVRINSRSGIVSASSYTYPRIVFTLVGAVLVCLIIWLLPRKSRHGAA